MAGEAVEVSVVTPSYGRFEQLRRCLQSIRDADRVAGGLEVVVVSAGYSDAEHAALEQLGARLVTLAQRLYLSASRNAGARAASGRYLVFLDDDNTVAPDAIGLLLSAMQADPRIVMAGPAMYFAASPQRVWCAGVRRTQWLMRTRLVDQLPPHPPEQIPSEDFPNCFGIRRPDFDAVGGFDERRFPIQYEESDLARRLVRNTGGRVVCVTGARVWHDIDLDLTRRLHIKSEDYTYWLSHGRTMYAAVHGDRRQWVGHLALGQWLFAGLYVSQTMRLPRAERLPVARGYLRGLTDGLREGWRARGKCPRPRGA